MGKWFKMAELTLKTFLYGIKENGIKWQYHFINGKIQKIKIED
jgi:hypothetical protein